MESNDVSCDMIKGYDEKGHLDNLHVVSLKLVKKVEGLKERIGSSQEVIRRTRKLIDELRGETEKAAMKKSVISDLFNRSEEVRTLFKEKEQLEDKIVEFKLLIANIKGEIESMDDLKREHEICISEKNSEIHKLSSKAAELKGDKHKFIMQYAKNSVIRHQKKKSGVKSFFKGQMRQYPSSSFQFKLSFENTENPVQSLHTSVIERTVPSLITGASSRYSEV